MGTPHESEKMAARQPTGDVVTMVCLTCGNEKYFRDEPPQSMKCDRCEGTVFRRFDTPTRPDEVTAARMEQQERDISLGDASADTAGDLRDLEQS
ncbi:MAG: hypothetical protein ACRENI_07435 [Gemmatimonadaceae bacterium]